MCIRDRDYMEKQAEVDKKLNEANQMYEKKISEAKEEAEKIKQATQREALAEKEKIIKKAQEESEEMIKEAENARKTLILDMEKKIKEKAIEEAVELIKNSLSDDVRLIIHNHLVGEFMKGGVDNLKVPLGLEGVSEATIKSAFPLEDTTFDIITSKLKEKVDKDIKFTREEDNSLISGLLVNIGSVVIDASLKWIIKEKARQLLNDNEQV